MSKKTPSFELQVSKSWQRKIDGWRKAQADAPTREEAVYRLIGMGLRFGVQVGDSISVPEGRATVSEILSASGHVMVTMKNGEGHVFRLSEINVLPDDD
jgi:hypothetical protein